MGLLKMKNLKLLTLASQKEKLVEHLLRLGVLEIKEKSKQDFFALPFSASTETEDFSKKKKAFFTEEKQILEKASTEARKFLKFSTLSEKRTWSFQDFQNKEKGAYASKVLSQARVFLQTLQEREEANTLHLQARLEQAVLESFSIYAKEAYAFWESPFLWGQVACFKNFAHFEREKEKLSDFCPVVLTQAKLLEEKQPKVLEEKETCFVLWVSLRKEKENLWSSLVKSGAELYDFPSPENLEVQRKALQQKCLDLEKKKEEKTKEAQALALSLQDFENAHDLLLYEEQKNQVNQFLYQRKYFIYLEAYVPEEAEDVVSQVLKQNFTVSFMFEEIKASKDYPIAFQNHPWVEPYESITEMFSMPHAKEIDPTPALAPFYFLFFGLMFSDLAYGLLLSACTAFMVWGLKVKGGMRKMCLMLFQCGFSAAFWGLLFGGFFGNLLDAITGQSGFFPPLWFNPTTQPMEMIVLSVAVGIVHLVAGLLLKMKILWATGQKKEALLDIFPWCLILLGIPWFVLQKTKFLPLPESVAWLPLLTGVLLLLLFAGRESKNPLLRLVKGLGALYGATGYLSDLMSYTRILALCLATSVIAMVVNNIGVMGGFTVHGFVMFVLIGLLGHGLNFALSVLGAYVHSTRLQFVEFFGKFYEGGGRTYKAHKIEGRYTKVDTEGIFPKFRKKSKLSERFAFLKEENQ